MPCFAATPMANRHMNLIAHIHLTGAIFDSLKCYIYSLFITDEFKIDSEYDKELLFLNLLSLPSV